MRRLLAALALLLLPVQARAAANAFGTQASMVLGSMFVARGTTYFGFPPSNGAPFTCDANGIRAVYYDTGSNHPFFCNGSAWASMDSSSAAGSGSCTNQFVTATNAGAAPTCTTATLASAQFANQGTTAQVLIGNAAGNPTWANWATVAATQAILPSAVDTVALGSTTVPFQNAFFGESSTLYGLVGWSKTDTNHHMRIEVDSTNRCVGVIDKANDGFNYAAANSAYPCLKFYGPNQNTTQWMSIGHDGTNGQISVGTGTISTGNTVFINNSGSMGAPALAIGSPTTDGLIWRSAGVLGVTHSGTSLAALNHLVNFAALCNYNILPADSLTAFSNAGAGGSCTINLPTAVAGETFYFMCEAAQTFTVKAGTGATIRNGSSVSASAGTAACSAVGASMMLTATSTTTWVFIGAPNGTWTIT